MCHFNKSAIATPKKMSSFDKTKITKSGSVGAVFPWLSMTYGCFKSETEKNHSAFIKKFFGVCYL
jgi:hypothetical protein